jgi:hypothetical protein
MNSLKKLIQAKRSNEQKAMKHYYLVVSKKVFIDWKTTIEIDLNHKKALANNFYEELLKRHCFASMKQAKLLLQIEAAKANRFYRFRIKSKLFDAWTTYKTREKEKSKEYDLIVAQHNDKRIKIKYFNQLKMFPIEMKRDRERQKRIDNLRSKVKQIIPDFND